MNDTEKLTQFLSKQQYMILAVILPDGTPWVFPVRLRRWEANVFEWDSKLDTEHSKALEMQPEMAVTMYEKLENSQYGVYLKGTAELVEEFAPGVGRYRFTAEECWVNDETFRKRQVALA